MTEVIDPPVITPFPTPLPGRGQPEEIFNPAQENFVQGQAGYVIEQAALANWQRNTAVLVEGLAAITVEAADNAAESVEAAHLSAEAAKAVANFVGQWSDLVGELDVPATVEHNNKLWALLVDLADVTASEPGDENGDWLLLNGTAGSLDVVSGASDVTPNRVTNVAYLIARGYVGALDLTAVTFTPGDLLNKGFFIGYSTAIALGISSETVRGCVIYYASSDTAVGIYRKFIVGNVTYTQAGVDNSNWGAWSRAEYFLAPIGKVQSLGSVSGTVTVNLNLGLYIKLTQTGNMSLVFIMPDEHDASAYSEVTIDIARTGAHTVALPAGSRWDEGAVITFSTSNTDTLVMTRTGSDNWLVKRGRRAI